MTSTVDEVAVIAVPYDSQGWRTTLLRGSDVECTPLLGSSSSQSTFCGNSKSANATPQPCPDADPVVAAKETHLSAIPTVAPSTKP